MSLTISKFAGALAISALFAMPAFAAGDGGSSSDPAPTSTKSEEQKCKETKGKVWNKKTKKCVNADDAMLDIDSIYETGRDLAMMGRYEEAIALLTPASASGDKRVFNYLGYSWRKSGDVEKGLTYYNKALSIDPDYVLVREYLGEALIQKGDLAGAKAQLQEIAVRCGETCEPYVDLKAELAKAGI